MIYGESRPSEMILVGIPVIPTVQDQKRNEIEFKKMNEDLQQKANDADINDTEEDIPDSSI